MQTLDQTTQRSAQSLCMCKCETKIETIKVLTLKRLIIPQSENHLIFSLSSCICMLRRLLCVFVFDRVKYTFTFILLCKNVTFVTYSNSSSFIKAYNLCAKLI